MINPLKSEEDAFRFTLIVVALLAPVVIVAIAFSTGVALGVAGGLALGLVVGLFVLKRDEPRSKAELRPRRQDGTHRILVVANETLSGSGPALRDLAAARTATAPSCASSAPALNSKIKHWTNEEDEARASCSAAPRAAAGGACAARASRPRATSATTIPSRPWRMRCGGFPPTR